MSWERIVIGLGVVVAVAVLLALFWPVARHRLIYPGGTLSPERSAPSAHGLPHGEEVWLEAEDGVRVHAWWVPARDGRAGGGGRQQPASDPGASRDGTVPGAVIYCHGNAETMATRAWIADRLSRLGYHTLLFDYRGYGLSDGRASEEGLARDARAAWRHVVETRGVPQGRVVLMGHSLGSAVATRLALELQADGGGVGVAGGGEVAAPEPAAADADGAQSPAGTGVLPAGLVVGAPFPSMPALFAHHAPWLPDRALRWRTERLDAGSRLVEVRVPILVVIGTEDDVIPPEMSREVHSDAAGGPDARAADSPSPVLVAVPADHATMMGHPDVWAALEAFFDQALP